MNDTLSIKEQAMLLSAMLFSEMNALEYLPDEQKQRLLHAKSTFIARPEHGLASVFIELKRLLMIDEMSWIHQSWIEHALESEPAYLRPMIEDALRSKSDKIPSPVILSPFLEKLHYTPFRLAVNDPVLMSLQSLKSDEQRDFFAHLGCMAQMSGTGTIKDGLGICATYLASQKPHWQRIIILSLHKDLGEEIKSMIAKVDPIPSEIEDAQNLLLEAMKGL